MIDFLGVFEGHADPFEEPPEWSVALVRERLEDASRKWEKIGGKIGPDRIKTAWPDFELHGRPDWFSRNATLEGDFYGTRRPDKGALDRGIGAKEAARVEEAIEWPWRYLSEPIHDGNRRALQSWMWCCAKNKSFKAYLIHKGIVRQTAYRRIERASAAILVGVIRDGIPP